MLVNNIAHSRFQAVIKQGEETRTCDVECIGKQEAIQRVMEKENCLEHEIVRLREFVVSIEMEDDRSLKQLAQEALDVQNASNLLGIANSFSKAMNRLRRVVDTTKVDIRTHPITVLWVDKISDMTGRGSTFGASYTKVSDMAAAE